MNNGRLPTIAMRALSLCAGLIAAYALLAGGASVASAATTFDRLGAFSEGGPDGTLVHSNRIAVEHSTGSVIKTDTVLDQLTVYEPDAESAVQLTAFGSGVVTDPFGLAINQSTGDVYVSDSDSVVKFSSDGAAVPTYTLDAGFTSPSVTGALAFDQSANQLLVADKAAGVVRRYSVTGSPGATFDGSAGVGSPGAFAGLQDLAVDSTGDVLVVDSTGDPAMGVGETRVMRYSAGGAYEASLTTDPQAATVAVRPSTDEVIVSARQDSISQGTTPTVTVFAPDASTTQFAIEGSAASYSTVTGLAVDGGPAGQLYVATDVDHAFGGSYGAVRIGVYEPSVAASGPPTATTSAATDVLGFSATLNGNVDTLGFRTTYHFEYAVAGTGEWVSTEESSPFRTPGPASAAVTGLAEDTTYDFRLVATNNAGATTTSPVEQLTTVDILEPTVTIDPPANITPDGADLVGSVNPEGDPTVYRFEYSGDDGASWNPLPGPDGDPFTDDDAGSGTAAVPVTATASGLLLNGTYKVRLVATNGGGPSIAEAPLQTTPVAATAVTDPVSLVQSTSVTLKGTINTANRAGSFYFEYGLADSYGSQTEPESLSAGSAVDRVAITKVSGLSPGTIYHYRLVATNGVGGPTEGADGTFTTTEQAPAATTLTPQDVTADTAVLRGTVDTVGKAGTFRFTVTETGGLYSQTTPATEVSAGAGVVSAAVADLPAGRQFTVRLSVTTSTGSETGEEVSFSTVPKPTYLPAAPPPPDSAPYGCANPHLNAPSGTVKPGQTITLTGTDLGIAGNVAFGDGPIDTTAYSATAVTFTVPADAAGVIPVTVNCSKTSNTIGVTIATPPSNAFTVKMTVNGTLATLKITVPGPGKLKASGTRLTGTTKTATKKGTVTLSVALTKAGRTALNRSKTGLLAVRVTVRFTPTDGTARTMTRTVTFKQKATR
jgi:hypothetical protein